MFHPPPRPVGGGQKNTAMKIEARDRLRTIMQLAWQFVRQNRFSMREALRKAWANAKLLAKLRKGVAIFTYQKINGETRAACGTLLPSSLPPSTGGGRPANNSIQVYFDLDKCEFRCFKKANLCV